MTKKVSPMYKQYKKLKANHPQALLLYRLGDFYELFEEDAEIGARELGLTLTRRRFSKDVRLPMAGFPHRYVNSYIARLIAKGHMVAVADQLEDSRHAKGLVRRGVVRVITSGTIMDDSLLKDYRDNFLMALVPQDNQVGLAFLDISTGDFNCTQVLENDLLEEIGHIRPSEIILPPHLLVDEAFCQTLRQQGATRLSPVTKEVLTAKTAEKILKTQFQVSSLEAYSHMPLGILAAGAILHYLQSNHLANLGHITQLTTYHLPDYLALDSITRRNLELTRTLREGRTDGTLFAILNQTNTRMGARLLRRWINQPLYNFTKIQARLDAVERLVNEAFLREDLQTHLKSIYDLERLAGRIGYGNANGRDLVNLKMSLKQVAPIKKRLQDQPEIPFLTNLENQLDPLTHLIDLIERAVVEEPPILIKEGGLIKAGFDDQLETWRQTARENRDWLTTYEATERKRTGIKNLRVKYNQVFGFFIEITKSNLASVPPDYERRATITTGERFITPELKKRETLILNAEDAANELEYTLFLNVRQIVADHLQPLRQTAQALAHLDVLTSLAQVATLHNYTKPTLTTDPVLALHQARHPVVEQLLPGETPFVPNDCVQHQDQGLVVLTGPNMSGKSVYLRQVALAVLMAHMGSFVPAARAEIGLTDRIFARAGASDDISQGRSTFLVEMSETAHILHHATERSLVILDEVGRGTSTYDGLSLAWAVAEDIHCTIKARCFFATHFHELTALGDELAGAANFCMAVHERDGEVIFLRQLIPGGADRSYGIHVAQLAGLPPRILQKARTILNTLETRNDQPVSYQPATHQPQPAIAETSPPYLVETEPASASVVKPAFSDEADAWQIIADLYRLDIANLTPLKALMQLNRWQQTLKNLLQK